MTPDRRHPSSPSNLLQAIANFGQAWVEQTGLHALERKLALPSL